MMKLEKLSSEIMEMKKEIMVKSEMLFKELFKRKLEKWLIMDENGNIVGYEVNDITEENQDFLALQEKANELIEVLKWELLDWRFFPYEEAEIVLERGSMVINVKNELLNIGLALGNFFEMR